MIAAVKEIIDYRELLYILTWKSIAVRYKQAYLGIAWAGLKPLTLMLLFTLVRSFVGIDSGTVPYPLLTFAALMPWIFFQEITSDAVSSVVSNALLVRKIYFPREIFPLTAVLAKLVDLGVSFAILIGLMMWYGVPATVQLAWLPLILVYTILASLSISLAGAAANVYYRDVSTVLPVVLSLLMYASPVIYPLALVKEKLLVQQAAGAWSDWIYVAYTVNPLAGIIDAFQNAALRGAPPDPATMLPGLILTCAVFPISYLIFKHAEDYFADVI